MKKIIITLICFLILISTTSSFANELITIDVPYIEGEVEFEWIFVKIDLPPSWIKGKVTYQNPPETRFIFRTIWNGGETIEIPQDYPWKWIKIRANRVIYEPFAPGNILRKLKLVWEWEISK